MSTETTMERESMERRVCRHMSTMEHHSNTACSASVDAQCVGPDVPRIDALRTLAALSTRARWAAEEVRRFQRSLTAHIERGGPMASMLETVRDAGTYWAERAEAASLECVALFNAREDSEE
jgi:hypothetical protein